MTKYTSPCVLHWEADYVDADFQASHVNNGRALGCSPATEKAGTFAPIFEESFPLIPASEWPDLVAEQDRLGGGLDRLIVHRYDQDGEGTCTSNQEAQGGNVLQAIQFGKDRVIPCSPISIYMQVAPGPNTGSAVGDCLRQHQRVGALPLDTPRARELMGAQWTQGMDAVGYNKRKYWTGWEDTARYFRIDRHYDVTTPEGFITALLRGWPVGYGRSQHSILGVGVAMNNGVAYVRYINSWGAWGETRHGIQAYGYDSPRNYGTGAARYGCNAKVSVVVPPWERERMRNVRSLCASDAHKKRTRGEGA